MWYRTLSAPKKWIIKGIPIIFVMSACMHSIYDLTKKNVIVGAFAPVNESIWEHLKLVPIPMIIWWVVYYLIKDKEHNINKNRWFTSAAISLIITIRTIPSAYYLYTGALGMESVMADIGILFWAIFAGQTLALWYYTYYKGVNSYLSIAVLIIVIVVFAVCTFYPLELPIFMDNSTNHYGIMK